MNSPVIIGVAGTNGSGKDTVMNLLADKYNFLFASATDLLSAELLSKNLPTDRIHKAELAAQWRRQHGHAVIVDKAYQTFKEQPAGKYAGLVVGSLRHPAEADAVHELGGKVLWVDADPQLRYQRVQAANREGRASEDKLSFEQFMADEAREMTPVGDAATLSMSDVKAMADATVVNEGSLEELERNLTEVLA